MRRLLPLLVIISTFAFFAAGTLDASTWRDRTGGTHGEDEQKRPDRKVIVRNNLNDAVEYLAADMLRAYPSYRETANLAVGSFVLTNTRNMIRSSDDVAKRLSRELEKNGKFEVIDRKDALNREAEIRANDGQEFQENPYYYKKLGRPLGADVILHGKFSVGNKFAAISARLVDVETERTLTLSNVYLPRSKVNASEVDWPEHKDRGKQFEVLLLARVEPKEDLIADIERQIEARIADEYDTKIEGSEVFEEEFDDAYEAPPEEADGEAVSEEDILADLGIEDEGSGDTGSDEEIAYEEEEGLYDEEVYEIVDEEESADGEGAEDGEMTEESDEDKDDKKDKKKKKKDVNEVVAIMEADELDCFEIEMADRIEAKFSTNMDGYAFMFSIDERGAVRRVFPLEDRAKFAGTIERNREYILNDVLSTTPGCQRLCLVVSDEPFRLDVDRVLLRRMACEEKEVGLPWIKGLAPESTFAQQTLCFQQKREPIPGMPTPTPLAEGEEMSEADTMGGGF